MRRLVLVCSAAILMSLAAGSGPAGAMPLERLAQSLAEEQVAFAKKGGKGWKHGHKGWKHSRKAWKHGPRYSRGWGPPPWAPAHGRRAKHLRW